MLIDPTFASTTDHPYRAAIARTFDPESVRVPYDGQTQMRLKISSGLAHARIVIDPAARDLFAIESGDGPRPRARIRLATGEIALTCRVSFGDWLRGAFASGLDELTIVLHPAVEWTIAVRGGLSNIDCDLSAGAVARIDVAGGCSDVMFDLPVPTTIVPIRISGGASHVGLRRPGAAGVAVGVGGGISQLWLDDRGFGAIGGPARFHTNNVDGTPHYELSIRDGASDLAIERSEL